MRSAAMPGRRSDAARRRLLTMGAAATLAPRLVGAAPAPVPASAPTSAAVPTPAADACLDFDALWTRFVARCVQADGRVVDHDTDARVSTSEGQAYTLFFALVADDRARFDSVLDWTRRHLAGGDFAQQLPAWQWGRQGDGRWGVLDRNAATDADLWLAHTLFEAERAWNAPAYGRQARAVLARIAREEVADVPGLGPMLLPGPVGFVSEDRRTWRLNPSYWPLHQLRALASLDPKGPWEVLVQQGFLMLRAASPNGLAPDWIAWQVDRRDDAAPAGAAPTGQWIADPVHGDTGSYDAIRCYLWAGLLSPHDPLRKPLLYSLRGLQPLLRRGQPVPERVTTRAADAATRGDAPPAFDAATLPYLAALADHAALADRRARLGTALRGSRPLRYYDFVLLLFGVGALQGRWRFGRDGRLQRIPASRPRGPATASPSPCLTPPTR